MSGFHTDKNVAKRERKIKRPLDSLEQRISSNAKSMKRLRKEIGYHPSDPRSYAEGEFTILSPRCSRSVYQKMKRTGA